QNPKLYYNIQVENILSSNAIFISNTNFIDNIDNESINDIEFII
ncbi:10046_t:CDS:1, partial [Cetraspora pellucida]